MGFPEAGVVFGDRVVLLLRGMKVRLALSELLTARLPPDDRPTRTRMLRNDGTEIDDVIVAPFSPACEDVECWLLLTHAGRAADVRRWIQDLSDGCLAFDEKDLQRKIDGPTVVEDFDPAALSPELRRTLETAAQTEPQVDVTKPHFIGQAVLYAESPPPPKKRCEITAAEIPLRRTVLNQRHRDLGAKLSPFAGWEMPIHYPAGILAEHRALRTAAALFDVSHMGAFEIRGPHAAAFLEGLLANCISRLASGEAQYSALLTPEGTHMDDVLVYRFERDRFMIVSNAANAERVSDWMTAVNTGEALIDLEMPGKRLDGPVEIRKLRDAGEDGRIGLAFQGPLSCRVLLQAADRPADRGILERMLPNRHALVSMAGLDVCAARTGYTGEKIGFELYVRPANAGTLWDAILETGKPLGVLPAGLGARDSARLEAGFPLFGHEIEGPLGISMAEAGYGWVPRLHVPFFIGRAPYMERAARSRRHVLRLGGQGRKTLRPGHVILDSSGSPAAEITSFAYTHEDMTFVLLACAEEPFHPKPGSAVRGVRLTRDKLAGPPEERHVVDLKVLTRFPKDEERDAWPTRYA